MVDAGLRKRRAGTPSAGDAGRSEAACAAYAAPSRTGSNKSSSSSSHRYNNILILLISSMISLAILCFIICGFVLRSSFHNGKECDMTYSRYKFLPIQVANHTPGARPYRLLKFVDARDPRNTHLWNVPSSPRSKPPATSSFHDDGTKIHQLADNWCLLPRSNYTVERGMTNNAPYPNPGHPVLFVPGHWGEYRQARSLGAHGLQFTRKSHSHQYQQKIARGLMDGDFADDGSDIDGFVYDVYTADFDGEGGGLHGSRLVRQAHFIAKAILTIAQGCDAASITIVAHSVGGIVARAVAQLYPETRKYVKSIITLATPHVAFPYPFDMSVFAFDDFVRRRAKQEDDASDVMIVSISGGLRDELIPPHACQLNIENGVSVLATDIMPPCTEEGNRLGAAFGMDHKAISWCHNVLSVVRRIIFEAANLSFEEDSIVRMRTLSKALDLMTEADFAERVRSEERRVMRTYGYLQAIALETTMPYMIWEFVVLYFLAAGVQTCWALVMKRNGFWTTCKFLLFLPIPLARVAVSIFALKWETFASTAILAYAACMLYTAILHGFLPLISKVLSLMGRRIPVLNNSCKTISVKTLLFSYFSWICTSAIISAVIMYVFHAIKVEEVNFLNWGAGVAIIFWSMVFLTIGMLFSLLANSGVPKIREKQRTIAALFTPILPFAVAGKIIYTLSLVSAGGQQDEEIYAAYEKHDEVIHSIVLIFLPLNIFIVIAKHTSTM